MSLAPVLRVQQGRQKRKPRKAGSPLDDEEHALTLPPVSTVGSNVGPVGIQGEVKLEEAEDQESLALDGTGGEFH